MFDYTKTDVAAGAFLLAGLAAVAYLSLSLGGLTVGRDDSYRVVARFSNVGDLKLRAPVKVAGVTVGKVRSIKLADYFGEAELVVERKVVLPADTIASITTAGLLGDAYVSLSPGSSDRDLGDGDRIVHTESALNMADILGRYAFGGGASSTAAPDAPTPGASPAVKEKETPLR